MIQTAEDVAAVSATEASRRFRAVLDRVHRGERVVISHMGRPVAVMVRWEPDGGESGEAA